MGDPFTEIVRAPLAAWPIPFYVSDSPSSSDLPPLPPGYEPDPEVGHELEINDEASLDFAFSSSEAGGDETEYQPDASLDDRAGYGRLPNIKIIDDTVIQSARRLGIGALVLFGTVVLIVVLTLVAVFFLSRTASSAIPQEDSIRGPANETNLLDGEYVMTPELMLISGGQCIFVGQVATSKISEPRNEELVTITLSGSTLAECGTSVEGKQGEYPPTADSIRFQVVGGKALILRLESPTPIADSD